MTEGEWHEPRGGTIGLMLDARAMPNAGESILLLLMNARDEPMDFTLPTLPVGTVWERMLDTALDIDGGAAPLAETVSLPARALILCLRV